MLNDRSSLLSFLQTRRSGRPREMVAPGPDAAQLRDILGIGMRVPDHGKLAPWRFIVIESDQRAAFASMLKSAMQAERPGTSAMDLDALDQVAHQAPAMVAVLFTPDLTSKIPLWEQQLSAGAACMNIEHGAHALGFVAGWITGWPSTSAAVVRSLGGGDKDRVAGFIYIGTPSRPLEERPRPAYDAIVRHWRALPTA